MLGGSYGDLVRNGKKKMETIICYIGPRVRGLRFRIESPLRQNKE